MPALSTRAAAMLAGPDGRDLFLQAKGILAMLAPACWIADLQLERPGDEQAGPAWADRQVRLVLTAHGRQAGTLALLSTRCRRLAGIEGAQIACFELNLGALTMHATQEEDDYQPIPEWPESTSTYPSSCRRRRGGHKPATASSKRRAGAPGRLRRRLRADRGCPRGTNR